MWCRGGGGGNAVHGVAGQGRREQEHHECPGRQSGVKNVLSQSAAQAFDYDDCKDAAQHHYKIGGGGGQGQGKEQPRDQGGAVGEGIAPVGKAGIEPFRCQGGGHGDRRHPQGPHSQHPGTHGQRGNQGNHHIQHQAAGFEVPPDVGRRSYRQIHFLAASFSICLPARMVSTRGSFPGQVKAQLPHSIQSVT